MREIVGQNIKDIFPQARYVDTNPDNGQKGYVDGEAIFITTDDKDIILQFIIEDPLLLCSSVKAGLEDNDEDYDNDEDDNNY
jgi:hypothetical protein